MPAETFVHPAALVEPGAQLGGGVRIGPFCHVGGDAVLGDGTELFSHVTIMGATSLGAGCKVYPHAVLGGPPQNTKHKGGRTKLAIGANTVIREFVSMHTGTDGSRGETTVGENGNFLAYVHIAHDCIVGRNAVFANGATLAGHCEIGDFVTIGGLTALHQFVRIGDGAFIGGCSAVSGDVIPFGRAAGNRARLRGLNLIGMRRSGMKASDVAVLRTVYKRVFDPEAPVSRNLEAALAEFGDSPIARKIIDFLDARSKRPFTVPPLRRGADDADDDFG